MARSLKRGFTFLVSIGLLILLIVPSFQVATATSLALDGQCSATGTTAPSCTLTTTGSSDVIIVFVSTSSGTIGTPSGGGLTFTSRVTGSSTGETAEEFYASGAPAQSGVTISDSITGGTSPASAIIAFGVSGADSSVFDASIKTTPPTPTSGTTGTIPSITFSTAGTDDFLIGLAAMTVSSTEAAGSGFTLIATPSGTLQSAAGEYKITAASGSQTVDFGSTVGGTWVMLGDAIVSTAGVPEFPFGFLPLLLLVPVVYMLLRARAGAMLTRFAGATGK